MLKTEEIRKMIAEGKGCYVPKEDLELFYENEEDRKKWSKEGIRNLYCAVCYRAVEDYENARECIGKSSEYSYKRLKEAKQHKVDLEKFFGSNFWEMVTHTKKDQAIRSIEGNMRRKAMKKMVR